MYASFAVLFACSLTSVQVIPKCDTTRHDRPTYSILDVIFISAGLVAFLAAVHPRRRNASRRRFQAGLAALYE